MIAKNVIYQKRVYVWILLNNEIFLSREYIRECTPKHKIACHWQNVTFSQNHYTKRIFIAAKTPNIQQWYTVHY